ncbi:MAG: hypothetical protein KZQ83_14970 [gamma proteobacterium symbiont of Taylorina sp.]|nr:hypothetical protein [gamma proteobacterium symbiont of Taylorina sp.]
MPIYLIDLFSDIAAKKVTPTNIRFKVVLTGSADSLPDYEYPLKNYSGTHYSGKTSYLNFVMPYSVENLQAYNDRPNGDIELYRIIDIGGETGETLIATGNPELTNFYKGAIASSFTMRATKQVTNSNPKTYNLENVINISVTTTGERIFEVVGFNDIKAGDDFIYESETITAEQIVMIISTTNFTYKIKELI